MHFPFNLLRIKGLYLFRVLLAHPQEGLHKRHLVYCVRIMSVGCAKIALQPCHSQLTLYARNIPNAVCVAPPEDEQVILETSRGLWFSINWMESASHWFHYTDILWYTVSKTLSLKLFYVSLIKVFALWRWSNKQCFNDAFLCRETGNVGVFRSPGK
jgi:hypothetical protein